MAIAWTSDGPPSPVKQAVLILKPGESALATLLADPVGVDVHWIDRRSRPCLGDECKIDHMANAPKWRAYLPAQVRRFVKRGECAGQPIGDWSSKIEDLVVELTEAHHEFLSFGPYRGMVVELHKPKGAVWQSLRLINTGQVEAAPAPMFEVKPILFRLWGVSEPKPVTPLRIHKQA